MKQRIEACVYFLAAQPGSGIRSEAATPLYHVFLTGEIERGEWKRMTGLAERTADRLLAACLIARVDEGWFSVSFLECC